MQGSAQNQTISAYKVVSTDPPYYDNIPYADLSDFFYVWLRRSLRTTYPELFRHNGRTQRPRNSLPRPIGTAEGLVQRPSFSMA